MNRGPTLVMVPSIHTWNSKYNRTDIDYILIRCESIFSMFNRCQPVVLCYPDINNGFLWRLILAMSRNLTYLNDFVHSWQYAPNYVFVNQCFYITCHPWIPLNSRELGWAHESTITYNAYHLIHEYTITTHISCTTYSSLSGQWIPFITAWFKLLCLFY